MRRSGYRLARLELMQRTLIILALALGACEGMDEQAYDRGYSDGDVVGYNTAYETRSTIIEGD